MCLFSWFAKFLCNKLVLCVLISGLPSKFFACINKFHDYISKRGVEKLQISSKNSNTVDLASNNIGKRCKILTKISISRKHFSRNFCLFKLFVQSFHWIIDIIMSNVFIFFLSLGIEDPPTQRGIIPRAFEHIFESIQVAENTKFLVHASYLEIYNEEIRDLLVRSAASSKKEYERETLSKLGIL